jgi:hypothetical protein
VAHRTVRCARPGQPSVVFCSFYLNPFLDFLLVCVEPLAPIELIILSKLVSPIICVGQFNHQNYLGKRFDPISLSKASDPCTYRPDLRVGSGTPTGATRIPRTGPGPLYVGSKLPTAGSRHSGTENTQALLKVRLGSSADTCLGPAWCRPVRVRYCSPPGRRPNAATWPIARDISQRAEPDVRPPGCATPAFIADKARRLTCDVPTRHLMRPVYSAVRRRHVHSTGRQGAASTFNETCPFRWQATCLSIPLAGGTPMLSRALCSSSLVRCQGSFRCMPMQRRPQIPGRRKMALATSSSWSKYYSCYVPEPTCRGSVPLYVPP